jgi:hypothetical protein
VKLSSTLAAVRCWGLDGALYLPIHIHVLRIVAAMHTYA